MPTSTESPFPQEHAPEFIVFGPDWNRHPSTSQHIARELLAESRVIWVETVGLRNPAPTWRDVRRSFQKLADFCTKRRENRTPGHPNLRVLSPPTLPFTSFQAVRLFNRWSVRRKVLHAAGTLGFTSPVLVITCPHQGNYVGCLKESCSIYLCPDDYSLWHGMNAAHVALMELDTLRRVDAVVTVSYSLADRLSQHGKPVKVISQGVDLRHFGSYPRTKIDGQLEIVYFGMIDERLDQHLLLKLARSMPEARIRLIGPRVADTRQLAAEANIRIEAEVAYAHLPESIASADMFILPFLVNPLTESCTPLKLKEYLATGRPVVSTPNPTALEWGQFVHVASSHDEFIRHLRAVAAQTQDIDITRLQKRLENESWPAKKAEFLSFVHKARLQQH